MGHYICELNEKVERAHIRYQNRYGLMIAGDLYTAVDLDRAGKHPALIVGAPYGGVKEQGPAVYANELAQRGFVVLTFDPCYMGESAGEPRHVSSPELFTENFSAGVDYLGLQPFVDRERIAVLGICGSGGFALAAAQVDTRIKAVIVTSMYDMSAAARMMQTPEQILEAKKALAAQRWAHSRFFSDHAYEKALEPKEMYVVEDAEHIDLYDRTGILRQWWRLLQRVQKKAVTL